MTVHLLRPGTGKFLCGLMRDGNRSFIPLDSWVKGELKPAGDTVICPFCRGAYDPLFNPGTAI